MGVCTKIVIVTWNVIFVFQAIVDKEKKLDGFVEIKESPEDEAKESLINNILWQMDNDFKTEALKQLQGHMWLDLKSLKGQ